MTFVTRFAPSPTGPLHLGHAFSALTAYDWAQAHHAKFHLRIEDIDRQRSKQNWEIQIYDDLAWLGITWSAPVMRQSDRQAQYDAALQDLWSRGLLYPCTCNRKDILAAASAPQEGDGVTYGPDGIVYPGTCRTQSDRTGAMPRDVALRLDMSRALATTANDTFRFTESTDPQPVEFTRADLLSSVGDIVVSRKVFLASYHLSVVLDDSAQGITHVIRGADLREATKIHVVLQSLLNIAPPIYHHHRLIRDDAGKRLAKRDDARAISLYRTEGASPKEIRALVGL